MNLPQSCMLLVRASLALLLASPLSAMESPPAAGSDEPVEEIEVTGQRSLIALQLQVEQAEDHVHLLFNELNTDDNYDIVCKEQERQFSRIKERTCMPQYAWNAVADQARAVVNRVQGNAGADIASPQITLGMAGPGMKEQMIEALRHSPELFDAIVRHVRLMEQLDAARATYFGDEAEED